MEDCHQEINQPAFSETVSLLFTLSLQVVLCCILYQHILLVSTLLLCLSMVCLFLHLLPTPKKHVVVHQQVGAILDELSLPNYKQCRLGVNILTQRPNLPTTCMLCLCIGVCVCVGAGCMVIKV